MTAITLRLLPGLLAFLSGFLFMLLHAGVEGEIAGVYGPSVSLYAGFTAFILFTALAGCFLAAAQEKLLGLRRGIYLYAVLLLLPLGLSLLSPPATSWGTNVLFDCLAKCLAYYGLTFAVLAAVPVLISSVEDNRPDGIKDGPPAPAAGLAPDLSLRYFGIFFLGAGSARLLLDSAAARLVGPGAWTGVYVFFAAATLVRLWQAPGRSRPSAAGSSDRQAVLVGAWMAAWFLAGSYVIFIVDGPLAGNVPHYLLFAALAICFIPALRRRLAPVTAACAVLVVIICLSLHIGPMPVFLFLLLIQFGRWVYWLKSETSGLNRVCVMLALGALGGLILSGAGLVRLDGLGAGNAGAVAYSLMAPVMCVWIILMWRGRVVYKAMSKYGTYKVMDKLMGYRVLLNRKVVHGSQYMEGSSGAPVPKAYYSPASPAGQLLARYPFERVAMVGLGSGAMCVYAAPGSWWTLYELDREVVHIAKTYFTALRQCRARLNFSVGDAAKTLEKAQDCEFDLMVLDVYAGRNIPEHMLSKEAFKLYGAKLKKDGVLLVHATGHGARLERSLGEHFSGPGVQLLGKSGYCLFDWSCLYSYWLLATSDTALLQEQTALGWKPIERHDGAAV